MELLTVVAPVFGTNCYVLVGADRRCVVIDAGAGVADRVRAVVRERDLVPAAVLATHGHADHTWDAAELTEEFAVPLLIHEADAYRLSDPFGTLGVLGVQQDANGPLAAALRDVGVDPRAYRVPTRVEPFGAVPGGVDGGASRRSPDVPLSFAGIDLVARHAPGHTEGSTLYLLDAEPPIAFTGDVLFAGSVGRVDLPGGDPATMGATLEQVVQRLAPSTVVLPGHGASTRIEVELVRNPYLGR